MSFVQFMVFISVVGLLMCGLDFVLGQVKKDWKRTPWEEDELGSN